MAKTPDNPYQPSGSEPVDRVVSSDPSIENEPHLRQAEFVPDPRQEHSLDIDGKRAPNFQPIDEQVDHTVWDEPGLSLSLTGKVSKDALTFENWLTERRAETSRETTWLITAAVAGVSGIWAVLGTFLASSGSSFPFLMVCIIGPLSEEVMKIALATWVVERRPFWFYSPLQIIVCAIASGLLFSVVENFLYLNVYIADPQPWLVHWRWTVCVALHVGCSTLAGIGLARIWQDAMRHSHRPKLTVGSRWLVAAVTCHALYNTTAYCLSLAGRQF